MTSYQNLRDNLAWNDLVGHISSIWHVFCALHVDLLIPSFDWQRERVSHELMWSSWNRLCHYNHQLLHHHILPLELRLLIQVLTSSIMYLVTLFMVQLHSQSGMVNPQMPTVFKSFGSLCYGHVLKHIRQKLDSKARECLFVQYCTIVKANRLCCSSKQKIIITHNAIFYEETPIQQQLVPNLMLVPSNCSFLFAFDLFVSTYVSLLVNATSPMSSHILPRPSTSIGESHSWLQEGLGASHLHWHEVVEDDQFTLSTPTIVSPNPMLSMGLSNSQFEVV